MNKAEGVEMLDFLDEVYPNANLTPALKELWTERLKPFRLDDVKNAIKEHLANTPGKDGFDPRPSLASVRELLKTKPAIGSNGKPVDPKNRTPADVIRADRERLTPGSTNGMNDAEIYLRYWRQIWKRSRGSDGSRRQCQTGVVSNLVSAEVGMPTEVAQSYAEWVTCDDDPGFLRVLEDLAAADAAQGI